MTHTADQIIDAMARAIDPWAWELIEEASPGVVEDQSRDRTYSIKQARAAYAVCLRMLREPTVAQKRAAKTAWIEDDQQRDYGDAWVGYRAMIDERIKELG